MVEAKLPPASAPERAGSPPPASDRGKLEPKQHLNMSATRRARTHLRASAGGQSVPFSAEALDAALLRESSRPHRESTPSASPHRKRQRINGDR
jgi:cell division cycle 20-like protein 1 (cofactor of APC complex)